MSRQASGMGMRENESEDVATSNLIHMLETKYILCSVRPHTPTGIEGPDT